MMGFKKRGVGLLTAAAMLISALAPGLAFADDEALELAAEKAVLDENFTETSMDQTALEALGWTGHPQGGAWVLDGKWGVQQSGFGDVAQP